MKRLLFLSLFFFTTALLYSAGNATLATANTNCQVSNTPFTEWWSTAALGQLESHQSVTQQPFRSTNPFVEAFLPYEKTEKDGAQNEDDLKQWPVVFNDVFSAFCHASLASLPNNCITSRTPYRHISRLSLAGLYVWFETFRI